MSPAPDANNPVSARQSESPVREQAPDTAADVAQPDRAPADEQPPTDKQADAQPDQPTPPPDAEKPAPDAEEPSSQRDHLSEDYFFDPDHRATPEDDAALIAGFADENRYNEVRAVALAKRDAAESLAVLSDRGAVALHGYTGHDLFDAANTAHRVGPDALATATPEDAREQLADFTRARLQVRAIVSAINELPPREAEMLRGINVGGNPLLAKLIADQYVPGRTTVEPTIVSASFKESPDFVSKFGEDVELHIQAKSVRDIHELSQNSAEREGVSPPGTQWYTHEKVTVEVERGGVVKQKTIIRVEEVLPGDPRYLDKDAAEREIADRRAANNANKNIFDKYNKKIGDVLGTGASDRPVEAQKQEDIGDALGTGADQTAPAPHDPSHINNRLDGSAPGYAGADLTAERLTLDDGQVGDHDWSPLSHATNPPSEAAIHAETANDNQAAKYVAERHPHLAGVNPRFHDADAFDQGYQTNCTRGVVASALRQLGIDTEAGPLRPHEMMSAGTLDHVRDRLGGDWQAHAGYDDVIRAMREQPVGSRAVIAVKYLGPDGAEYGHVAEVAHTREGVAFIDPQNNSLMRLPHPPTKLDLLPYDPATVAERHAANTHTDTASAQSDQGGYGAADPPPRDQDPAGERPLPTRAEIDRYLRHPRPQEAMRVADAISHRDPDSRIKVDGEKVHIGEAIAALLPRHPALARMLRDVPFLENSLLARPQTLANLLTHPQAIDVLEDCVREVQDHPQGPADLAETYEADPKPPPAALPPEQAETSALARAIAGAILDEYRDQPDFDEARKDDLKYRREYMDRLYDNWSGKQRQLHELAERVAAATGGHAESRKTEKSRVRANDKVDGYNGVASRLTDLVGSKIQYDTIDDAYRGLSVLLTETQKPESKIEIVEFSDRFTTPQKSGYRDLQMSVRMELPGGGHHVAELRLHLKSIDDVADYEHALFEVRRDLQAVANEDLNRPLSPDGKNRALTPEERALHASILNEEKNRFAAAFTLGGGIVRGDAQPNDRSGQ